MRNTLKQPASDGGVNTIATATPPGGEWGRLPKPKARLEGLSRTTILEMVQRGEVKSCVIKKRHAIRGIRLIFLPSLHQALERLVEKSGGTK